MQSILIWIYCLPVPVIIVAVILLTILFLYLQDQLSARRYWKPGLWICFFCWLGLVIAITVGNRSQETTGRTAVLIPLYSYMEVLRGENPEILRSNFMNVLLFYPAGLLLSAGIPQRCNFWLRFILIMLLGIAVSGCIEFCQYRYCLGVCEIDDVIHNALGAVLGALPCTIALRLKKCP